jgi:hypothetical protein
MLRRARWKAKRRYNDYRSTKAWTGSSRWSSSIDQQRLNPQTELTDKRGLQGPHGNAVEVIYR